MIARLLALAFVMTALSSVAAAQPAARATSPDGQLAVAVTLSDAGTPHYRVTYRGQPIIEPSRLGVVLAGGDTLGTGVALMNTDTSVHDTTWTQPWGEAATIRDNHTRLRLTFAESDAPNRRFVVAFRVFDNGIGFRYEWPAQPALDRLSIVDELTAFRFAADPTAWWIRAYEYNRYEYLYEETPLSEAGYALHTPLTLAFPDGGPYVAVHEAALVDYAAMSLRRTGRTTYQADLAPWSTGVRVYGTAPFRSPWRTLLIGDTAGDLITNYTTLNLNEPNALGDVSWVEPGKYIGIWWAMHMGEWTWASGPRHGATTAHTKRYIDFAAKHGFDGVLVEGWNKGWDGSWAGDGSSFSFVTPYPDYDFEALAAYARSKGTRLIGHHETGGNAPHYEAQLDTAYALMAARGVQAIKTGYVQWGPSFPRITARGDTAREWNYGQYMVRHYHHTVKEAAKHKLALNIHEPVKATGLRRTYPNLLTREGARGQEFNSPWGGGNGPDHIPTLVFTRMLAGPMDFTPGIFNLDATGDSTNAVPTTLAGQLSLYVVLYSPLQMAADLPRHYKQHLDAFQFIKDVPVDWAETRVLEAQIGDYVTIARKDRASAAWYLGAKTDADARTMTAPLTFLDDGTRYTATIYRDAAAADWETNPEAYVIETRPVTAQDTLRIPLAPGGGVAVQLQPAAP
ncbi:glycoside hydrolase family 97 protein [Salisaeta longa]|uniref:glycoside hydrolase family 97 protein n=1 Tax=Salisaeta longa TaxID=503170 RepID=UPI0003B676B1|nr:glycoside hydrolase family 97 protein [Salisaeta longa]